MSGRGAAGAVRWSNGPAEAFSAPTGDRWGEDDNARRYDAYAREYPSYRETSRDLVALALPSAVAAAAAAVLDLACGTGATAREILGVLGPDGKVTDVDKSAAMLGVAASSVTDPRATWIQARAENIDRHVTVPVDVVICNSAIWQTNVAATAMAVRAVMRAGGWFAFNVPTAFLDDDAVTGSIRHRLSRRSICRFLAAAGFEIEHVTEVSHPDSAESQRAWMSIPVAALETGTGRAPA